MEKAKFELWQYDTENAHTDKPQPRFRPVYQNAIPGVLVYILVVCLVAWLAGDAAFNKDWFAAGRIDGVLIREGEWWRSFTALTLHSGIGHLAGNIGFGLLFGLLAGSLLGSGVSWLAIVLAAATGNLANTFLLDSVHRAIGASTAVFAALGVVAGFSWRAGLMPQDRWAYRYGPIVGGIALLTYTGTGDENTDIGAHLAGFVCGFGAGMLLTMVSKFLPRRDVQLFSGVSALLLIVMAWSLAL